MTSFSRRQFLGASVAALSMASAAPRAFGATHPLRVGLLGCGQRGLELLRACAANPSIQVTAVSDAYEPRAREAASLVSARQFADWRQVVRARDVDAVIIATPDHWHAPMALAAMRVGKDVYCERPMALNLREAKALRDCAAATGRTVQIGAESAAQGQWRAMRAAIDSGAIGRVSWAQGAYHQRPAAGRSDAAVTADRLDWHAFQGTAARGSLDTERFVGWRGYWDYSASIAAEHHYDDLIGLLLATGVDYPIQVSAAGGVYAKDGREIPDSFAMTARYASGETLVLASGMAGLVHAPAVVRGEKGSISAIEGAVEVDGEDAGSTRRVAVDALPSLLDDWVGAIETRRPCLCGPDLGYKAMVVLSMAAESYRRGETMAYDPISETTHPCEPRLEQA